MVHPATAIHSDPQDIINQFQKLRAFLEDLLEDPGLRILGAANRSHPALAIYNELSDRISTGFIRMSDALEHITSTIRLDMDYGMLMTFGSGRAIKDMTDSRTRQFITDRARQSHTFADIGAELSCWGWLKHQGFDAHLHEDEGMPDVEVCGESPFWIEVKRIHSTTSIERIRPALKTANRQLKRADQERTGAVYMHIDRDEIAESSSDSIPPDVELRVAEVERTMSSNLCRQIAYVVVAWDNVASLANKRYSSTAYIVQRRSIVLSHRNPRFNPPVEPSRLEVGMEQVHVVETPAIEELLAPKSDSDGIGISSDAIDFSGFIEDELRESPIGVPKSQIRTALREASALRAYGFRNLLVLLATYAVSVGPVPYTMLVVCVRTGAKRRLSVMAAYKLYGNDVNAAVDDPMRVFLILLKRFGTRIRIGNHEGMFITQAVVRADEIEPFPIDDNGEVVDVALHAVYFARKEDGPPGRLRLAWIFGLRIDDYRRALAARSPLPPER